MQHEHLKDLSGMLCKMFCGRALDTSDIDILSRLGTGMIHIDVLHGSATLNRSPVDTFRMPRIMHRWFIDELQAHDIPIQAVDEANIDVEFLIQEDDESPFHIKTRTFHVEGHVDSGQDHYITELVSNEGGQKILKIEGPRNDN